jgi:hypothetical protein
MPAPDATLDLVIAKMAQVATDELTSQGLKKAYEKVPEAISIDCPVMLFFMALEGLEWKNESVGIIPTQGAFELQHINMILLVARRSEAIEVTEYKMRQWARWVQIAFKKHYQLGGLCMVLTITKVVPRPVKVGTHEFIALVFKVEVLTKVEFELSS